MIVSDQQPLAFGEEIENAEIAHEERSNKGTKTLNRINLQPPNKVSDITELDCGRSHVEGALRAENDATESSILKGEVCEWIEAQIAKRTAEIVKWIIG